MWEGLAGSGGSLNICVLIFKKSSYHPGTHSFSIHWRHVASVSGLWLYREQKEPKSFHLCKLALYGTHSDVQQKQSMYTNG